MSHGYWPAGREVEESELAATVLRAGYLETAVTPLEFTDIGDYLDEDPARSLAERSERNRRNVVGKDMRRGGHETSWLRLRVGMARDEWTP